MGMSTVIPFLLLLALLLLEEADAYLLDPNTVAELRPPKDYVASKEFNYWARLVVAGIGFSFLHAAGVILAIKRWRNKVINLYEYYDELGDYLLENFPDDFPGYLPQFITDDIPVGLLENLPKLPKNYSQLTDDEREELNLPDLGPLPPSPFQELSEKLPYIFYKGPPRAPGFLKPGIFPEVKFGGLESYVEGTGPLLRDLDEFPGNTRSRPTQSLPSSRLVPPGSLQGIPPRPLQGFPLQQASTFQKRSLQEPSPSSFEGLYEAVWSLLETDDIHEMVMKTAKLTQNVVKNLDESDCILKFLCYLQEKPEEDRAPEQDLLVSLFRLNATTEATECEGAFTNCLVEEKKLLETFSYSWPTQNTV